jgi:hypothetical protein
MSYGRGQSGVEYLTVYAMAFIILLVVLAGLYYMWRGGTTVTPYCEFSADFTCVGFSIKESGGLTLIMRQTTGHSITITGFNCTTEENKDGVMKPINVLVNDGEQVTVVTDEPCYRMGGGIASGSIGSPYSGKLFINYTETDTLMDHMLIGRIVAKYE